LDVAAEALAPSDALCDCAVEWLGAVSPAYSNILLRIDVDEESAESVAVGLSLSNAHVHLHRTRGHFASDFRANAGWRRFARASTARVTEA
jgi:hypothetical protein